MGWFSGNVAQINRDTRSRAAEAKGLMFDISGLAQKYAADTHRMLSELTTTQMQEASKAREGSIAAADVRNKKALEEGFAASSDPLMQAEIAGRAGADRSVVETIRARGKIEQGVLAKETAQHMQTEDIARAAETAGKLGEANVLGSIDEAVDPGARSDVMALLGIAAGANMEKIKGWFKGDPMDSLAPGSESLGQLAEVREQEVRGVDIPMSDFQTTRPAAPNILGNLFEGMRTESLGQMPSLLELMPPDRRSGYLRRHKVQGLFGQKPRPRGDF